MRLANRVLRCAVVVTIWLIVASSVTAAEPIRLAMLGVRLDGETIEGIGVAPHIRVTAIPGMDAPLDRALLELGCQNL